MDPAQVDPINRHLDTLYPEDVRRRLSEVKGRWDPNRLFRANYTLQAA